MAEADGIICVFMLLDLAMIDFSNRNSNYKIVAVGKWDLFFNICLVYILEMIWAKYGSCLYIFSVKLHK